MLAADLDLSGIPVVMLSVLGAGTDVQAGLDSGAPVDLIKPLLACLACNFSRTRKRSSGSHVMPIVRLGRLDCMQHDSTPGQPSPRCQEPPTSRQPSRAWHDNFKGSRTWQSPF
jgi:hypothetical protein